jgi:uncharacterized protein (DUF885 family)
VPTVTEISEQYVDAIAVLDPVRAARSMGVPVDETTLTDFSPEGTARLAEVLHRTRHDLLAADATSEAERLGRRFLLGQVEGELGLVESGERHRTCSVLVGPAAMVRLAFDLMAKDDEAAWERVAARLHAVPAAMAGHRASLHQGAQVGEPASRTSALAVAAQCAVWGAPGGWFHQLAASYGGGPLRGRLDEAADVAAAAYADLGTWLGGEYLAVADETDGVGEERYRVWARAMLGADLDVDDAYDWGWEEIRRIEREQAEECGRIVAGASFPEVRTLLNTDPDRGIAGVDRYRGWLQEITDAAIGRLNGVHFDIPAQLLRCIISIPPEGSAAAPYYTPPSEDLSKPGRTWFPTLGRTWFPTWDQVTIAYHEAVPGHHLQLGTTRVADLIRAHRVGFQSAHGEGWALYAERLMDELGELDRPDFRLGFLSLQGLRAARVVVDIGMHTGRPVPRDRAGGGGPWTPAMAADLLEAVSGMPRAFVDSEVQRYLSWPSQAISYKLGERAWLAGREAARAAAGPTFDLRRWHANALALGALGLDDLVDELTRC